MTDQNLTEIICIVDRSGSMMAIQEDAIGGFNQFLKDQQKLDVDQCNLTYVQFDTEYEMVHECLPIKDVPVLNKDTFKPRGCTALLDAVGKTIDDVGKRLGALPEDKRPGAVVAVIITDGAENASKTYNRPQIKEMIERQTNDYGWQFVFLGADQDAFAEAASIGVRLDTTANFDKKAIRSTYSVVGQSVSAYRGSKKVEDLHIGDISSD